MEGNGKFLNSKKGRVAVLALLLLIALILALLLLRGEEGYRTISVSELSGSVTAETDGSEYAAYPDMHLHEGNALTTQRESYARMVLDGDTYVKLEQESRAVFEALGKAGSGHTTIHLERGAITNELTRPLSPNESYVINTPNAILAVRGTFFRVEVYMTEQGELRTDVFTYGGTVTCRRILPSGELVDEAVDIRAGYKVTVSMDEIYTVYIYESLGDDGEPPEPFGPERIPERDLVDMYEASLHGHEMFLPMEEIWGNLVERGIEIEEHASQYDGGDIPPYGEGAPGQPGPAGPQDENGPNLPADGGEAGENTGPIPGPTAPMPTSPVEAGPQASPGTLPTATLPPAAAPSPTAVSTAIPSPAAAPTAAPSPSAAPAPTAAPAPAPGSGDSSGESSTPSAHVHTEVTETVEATTTAAGYKRTYCAVCGAEISRVELPMLIALDSTNFPDTIFRQYISDNFDTTSDGALSAEEIAAATSIDITSMTLEIPSLKGIEYFSKLKTLNCERTNIVELDLSSNTELTELSCYAASDLLRVNIKNNVNLVKLSCEYTAITELDLSRNTKMVELYASSLKTANLDLGNNKELTRLVLDYSSITALDISNNSKLEVLSIIGVNISTLNTRNNAALEELYCLGANITSLDLSHNVMLKALTCGRQNITTLDISKNINLVKLDCIEMDLQELDVSKNTKLTSLCINHTNISSLDVSNNIELEYLQCAVAKLAYLNLTNNTRLTNVDIASNKRSLPAGTTTFCLADISGFDKSKVSDVTGANYDKDTGILTNMASFITYRYDCGNGIITPFYIELTG